MEKLNIAKILKDCPKGMELDCTVFEDVYFDCIEQEKSFIRCYIQNDNHKISVSFTKYGCYASIEKSKCVIFPKGKTTWEGFQRPFKDGDIVVADDGVLTQMFILKDVKSHKNDSYDGDCYFGWDFDDNQLFHEGIWGFDRLATEEEKERLFKTLKDNGYRWNTETKTLEKLIVPKFKVGDRIKNKKDYINGIITDISDSSYKIEYKNGGISFFSIEFQDDLELVPNKFDITTLKPFNEVLVRQNNHGKWGIDFFGFYSEGFYYTTGSAMYVQCVPYKDNEHLRGTTNDCDDYYKTWK